MASPMLTTSSLTENTPEHTDTSNNTAPFFLPFSRLPPEIRILIWEATIEPRLIRLETDQLLQCMRALQLVSPSGVTPDSWRSREAEFRECPCPCSQPYDPADDAEIRMLKSSEEQMFSFKSNSPIPSIFGINQESRGVASKCCQLAFGSLGSIP